MIIDSGGPFFLSIKSLLNQYLCSYGTHTADQRITKGERVGDKGIAIGNNALVSSIVSSLTGATCLPLERFSSAVKLTVQTRTQASSVGDLCMSRCVISHVINGII